MVKHGCNSSRLAPFPSNQSNTSTMPFPQAQIRLSRLRAIVRFPVLDVFHGSIRLTAATIRSQSNANLAVSTNDRPIRNRARNVSYPSAVLFPNPRRSNQSRYGYDTTRHDAMPTFLSVSNRNLNPESDSPFPFPIIVLIPSSLAARTLFRAPRTIHLLDHLLQPRRHAGRPLPRTRPNRQRTDDRALLTRSVGEDRRRLGARRALVGYGITVCRI